MAIIDPSHSTPLVEGGDIVEGCVDYGGHLALRSSSGGWRSAAFITVVEMAERFAYFGICSNLITYLTGPLGQSTAAAAENVNIWAGISFIVPLLGGFIADSFLGRYRTIIFATLIYISGLSLLTLSALLTSLDVSACGDSRNKMSCSSPQWQVNLFFFSLYLVAAGLSGHKPCVQTFGAEQFDENHPKEMIAKSSFFNWWNFNIAVGTVSSQLILVYIQDNVNWAVGFGIPATVMAAAMFIFLLGRRTYRYRNQKCEKCQFMSIFRTARKSQATPSMDTEAASPEQLKSTRKEWSTGIILVAPEGSNEDQKAKIIDNFEETKALLRLAPIWFTSLAFAISIPQTATFFTKQGATMDRTIMPGFQVPAASLQALVGATIILCVPIYDMVFVPIVRSATGKPTGITVLQRIGTGMVLYAITMGTAALVETKRLETARHHGLVDHPNVTIPMSVLWLVPQYALSGVAYVFAVIGIQQFFYEEVPVELRSVGTSLYCSVVGVGGILCSFLVSMIDIATRGDDHQEQEGWFSDNLNKAHIDYFYWLLAGLNLLGFTIQLYFATFYKYKR